MNILILSDSHGRNLGSFDLIMQEKPDAVIHLGDHDEDAAELKRSFSNISVYSVKGNNDYRLNVPFFSVIKLDGIPIYLTHGHKEGVSMLNEGKVLQKAKESNCKIGFFGHTHRSLLKEADGIIICNPGSISLPRGGPPSYGKLITENGEIKSIQVIAEDGTMLWNRE